MYLKCATSSVLPWVCVDSGVCCRRCVLIQVCVAPGVCVVPGLEKGVANAREVCAKVANVCTCPKCSGVWVVLFPGYVRCVQCVCPGCV